MTMADVEFMSRVLSLFKEAVLEEREACAKIAENQGKTEFQTLGQFPMPVDVKTVGRKIAAEIRARK